MGSNVRPTVFIVCEGLVAPPRAGFQIHLLSLARALSRHVRVRAYCWLPDSSSEAWRQWVESLPPGPEPGEYLAPIAAEPRQGNALLRKLRCWKAAQKEIAAFAKPGDVLWVRDPATAIWALPSITRWLPGRSGLRYLYDVSSLAELEAGLSGAGGTLPARVRIEATLRREYDLIRTLGESMKAQLVSTGLPEEKIIVAPVGTYPPQAKIRPRLRVRKILYIGSAERWQGLPTLVHAMRIVHRELPEVVLSVVGVTREAMVDMDVSPNVQFLGWVDRQRIAELYDDHDLFVIPRPSLPLTEHVIPMKSVEALAYGIPILSSRLTAIHEVTGDDGAYFVVPGDAADLARGISDLAARPDLLRRLQTAAAVRASYFEWDAVTLAIVAALFPQSTR